MASFKIDILNTNVVEIVINDVMQISFPDESEDFNKGFKYFGEKMLQAIEGMKADMDTEDDDDGKRTAADDFKKNL